MASEKCENDKYELLQDYLHERLIYIKDELLSQGRVERAQKSLSAIDSHLYLWNPMFYKRMAYEEIEGILKDMDERILYVEGEMQKI